MNPREEKKRDLSSQCKNRYGNSDKAARKGVRRKKRLTTHQARRDGDLALSRIVSSHNPDDAEDTVTSRRQIGSNAKWPDTPIGEVIQCKLQGEIRAMLPDSEKSQVIMESYHDYCVSELQIHPAQAGAWLRYLRAVTSIGIVPIPSIKAEEQRDLLAKLTRFLRRQDIQSEHDAAPKRSLE